MDDFRSRQGECQETSGFLFSHQCGEVATNRCEKCGKDICDRHTVQCEGVLCCTTCGKQDRPHAQRPSDPHSRDPYLDDPYFYARSRYSGYHTISDDFTESDEAAVTGGAIAASELGAFEDDMGGS